MNKNVLLIGGGGTLGEYVSAELLKKGCAVDIICLEDKESQNENLCFFKTEASFENLSEFVKRKHYHGIINFIHYEEVESYAPYHKLLTENTDHLIFLSSYRVYADTDDFVTEETPFLLDTSDDEFLLEKEKYAISKAKAEKFIRSQNAKNWTIVRPVISFSDKRFDLVVHSGRHIIDCAKKGEIIYLPKETKNLTASLDWAGNTGKIIANLLFNEKAVGEAFTISSVPGLKWGEVADIYKELIGAEFKWVDVEEYMTLDPNMQYDPWVLKYDRLFDRRIDNSKVLAVTGLTKEDFLSVKEGIKIELGKTKD